MKLYESSEDYLESILIISKKKGSVHAIDIAKELGFTKASVSIAIHKLADNGYINIKKDGELVLTDDGYKVAMQVYERHMVLTNYFISLGVNAVQAEIDACKVEHDISKETFEAIKKVYEKKEL